MLPATSMPAKKTGRRTVSFLSSDPAAGRQKGSRTHNPPNVMSILRASAFPLNIVRRNETLMRNVFTNMGLEAVGSEERTRMSPILTRYAVAVRATQ